MAPYGEIADLGAVDPAHDVGLHVERHNIGRADVPHADWDQRTDRDGIVICDATSAIFAQPLDWLQSSMSSRILGRKVLGGEGGHGVLILKSACGGTT